MRSRDHCTIALPVMALLLFCLLSGCRATTSRQDRVEALSERIEYLEKQNKELKAKAERRPSLAEQNEELERRRDETRSRLEHAIEQAEKYKRSLEIRRMLLGDKRIGVWDTERKDNEYHMVLVKEYDPRKATVEQLQDEINRRYAQEDSGPRIKVDRIEDGIAFVEVLEGEWLTQRMGSAGPFEYVGRVTLTLTSLPEIDHVYLYGFEPGDHWGPGCLSRADVAGWREWWSGW